MTLRKMLEVAVVIQSLDFTVPNRIEFSTFLVHT